MIKKIAGLFAAGFVAFNAHSQQLSNGTDSLSYALGVDIAQSLKSLDVPLNHDIIAKVVSETLQGENALFSREEAQSIIRKKMMEVQEQKNAVKKQAEVDFFQKNKQTTGVKVDSTGIQYIVVREGIGDHPGPQDTVTVNYIGTLLDGTEFDNSYKRGEPITLSLDRVIEGWKIAIPKMRRASKYRFFIPYELAYGERDNGTIPPYSTLIFDIELVDFSKKKDDEVS